MMRSSLLMICSCLLACVDMTTMAQVPIGYIQAQGNNQVINLSVISVNDAISAGHGVVKVVLGDGTIGAADLVETTNFDASGIRISTTYGTFSWRKARVYGEAIGGTSSDQAYCISFTADHDLLLAGDTWSFVSGWEWNGLLMETNTMGDVNWAELVGYTGTGDVIYAALETSDGGYLTLGQSGAYNLGGWDIWIAKWDDAFNLDWGGGLGGANDDFARNGFEDDDGGIVFIGSTASFPGPDNEIYVRKFDATGGSVWGWSYGHADLNDWGFSVCKDIVPGYLSYGTTTDADSGDYDLSIRKISAAGVLGSAWKLGGRGGNDVARKVLLSHDGKYILSGYTDRFGHGEEDFYLAKRDTNMALIWGFAYGGSYMDKLWSAIRTLDHGFVMVGERRDAAYASSDIYVIKVDSTGGAVEWSWVCGGGSTDIGYDVVQDESGFYYVAGITGSIGAGAGDFIVMKFSPDGTTCATSFSSTADGSSGDGQAPEDFTYRRVETTVTACRSEQCEPMLCSDHPLTGRITERPVEKTREAVEPTLTVICY